MKQAVTKTGLLNQIETARRQLDRTLFYFEKDPDGAFVPSRRFRYSEAQAMAPGVLGSWSLYQVLAQVHSSERAFMIQRMSGLLGPGGISMFSTSGAIGVMAGLGGAPQVLPLEEFLEQYRNSHAELLSYLGGQPEAVFFNPEPTPLVGEILEASVQRYDWAKAQIQRWRKEQRQAGMTRAALLERIANERRSLEALLAELSPAQMTAPGVIGRWSVKDILAHLAAWEALFIGWYQAGLRGETPELPAPGFTWRTIDALNEQISQQHRSQPLAEVRAWFDASHQQFLALVREIPEADLFSKPHYAWQGKYRLVTYVQANGNQHYHWAAGHLRKWLKGK